MDFCRKGDKSVYTIAYNYINSHGKDLQGKSLGQYFIHGLGHNIGLDVHDPGESCSPLQPNMVVTVEPGIYIRSEEHTSELQSPCNLVCRLLLEKKKHELRLVANNRQHPSERRTV